MPGAVAAASQSGNTWVECVCRQKRWMKHKAKSVLFLHNIFPCIIVHRFEWKIRRWGADQSFIEIEVTYHKTLPFYILFLKKLKYFNFKKIEVDLLYCVSFRCTAKWFNYIYIHSDYDIFQIIIYFQIRLLQDIKHCSLSYTVNLCWKHSLLKHLKVYYQNCVTVTTI